jgi:hypothetical protein
LNHNMEFSLDYFSVMHCWTKSEAVFGQELKTHK